MTDQPKQNPDSSRTVTPRTILCPLCRKSPSSEDRSIFPFCSARCKTADLGAWAAEKYTIAGAPLEETLISGAELSEEELDALALAAEQASDDDSSD